MEPEKKTKKERPANHTKNEEKKNQNSLSEDWQKITVVVSVIGLVVSSLITAGLGIYSFQLTEQANSIAQKSLDLQNWSPIITVSLELPRLFDEGGYLFNVTTLPINSYGRLNGSLTVISPHYGKVNITIANFTVFDSNGILIQEQRNLTNVTFRDSYTWENREMSVYQGVSQLPFSIPFKATYYPDSTRIPSNSNSSNPYIAQIGILYLNAIFYDTVPTLHISETETFSTPIAVSIINA